MEGDSFFGIQQKAEIRPNATHENKTPYHTTLAHPMSDREEDRTKSPDNPAKTEKEDAQVFSAQELDECEEQATCDANDEDEVAGGWLCCLEEHIECPFVAELGGETVRVVKFDSGAHGLTLKVVCERVRGSKNKKPFKADILDLEQLNKLPREQYKWVVALRRFCRHR